MNAKQVFSRTRIAPTPSGFLHLGNAFSFALTSGLAKRFGATVLLRIDDLDRPRISPPYVQDIFDTLHFMEIPWDEGPRNYSEYEQTFSQIHRLPLYEEALQRLKDNKMVFACDCSRAKVLQESPHGIYPGTCARRGLPFEKPACNWRLHTDQCRGVRVQHWGGDAAEHALPHSMNQFVVRKKDGYPAYQLASLVDDVYFDVDLVVRGEDLWESTLAQLYLADVLGAAAFSSCTFLHHGLLSDSRNGKMSKSAGATSIQYLRKQGKTVNDIYRMIGQLLGEDQPVNNWEELTDVVCR